MRKAGPKGPFWGVSLICLLRGKLSAFTVLPSLDTLLTIKPYHMDYRECERETGPKSREVHRRVRG